MRRPAPRRAVVGAILVAVLSLGIAGAADASQRGLIWAGDFATGNLSSWFWVQACPSSVAVVRSPARPSTFAARITVTDGDLHRACPRLQLGPNPSAFLVSPALFRAGDDAYIAFSTYFPRGFPAVVYPHWVQVAQVYGAPFGGSPPISIGVRGNKLVLARDASHRFDRPWSVPLRRGTWHDLVLRIRFSPHRNVGFVQLWQDGVRQSFTLGRRTLHMATLRPGINWTGNGGTNSLFLDLYRSPGLGTVTVYHANARVGSTYSSVAR